MLARRPYSQIAKDCDPLSVFLVKSGSTGNHLLFRFPFAEGSHQRRPSGPEQGVESVPEPAQKVVAPASAQRALPATKDDDCEKILQMPDQVFTDLFAVHTDLCQQKFEVKINNIRFVGHPINFSQSSDLESQSNDRDRTDLQTVNIVFALRANATHDIVDCYHECSHRISLALKFEESRTGYLSNEAKSMLTFLDEETSRTDFQQILLKSLLASTLKKVFDDLRAHGSTHFTINHWMSISFCLPQKVHLMSLQHSHSHCPPIGPEMITKCLENLRPYHALLLLVDHESLLECLPLDASPAFLRVIRWINPIKNLIELSFDCDITLSQIFHVAAQLIYWGKVTVIYPLCENNKYTIHPTSITSAGSVMTQKFSECFPKDDLLRLLANFSTGLTLKQAMNISGEPEKMTRQVIWLLKHRLILQMHSYVFLLPSETTKIADLTFNEFQESPLSDEPPHNSFDCRRIPIEGGKRNNEDLFKRLTPYFDGTRHIEDIMFYEDIQRSDMMNLLSVYSDCLYTAEYDDRAVSALCPCL